MNDYNELIERCKEILEWKKTGLLKGDALLEYTSRQHYAGQYNDLQIAESCTLAAAAEALIEVAARVTELESRLEISPLHNVDGIMARDATIKLQDERIAELEAERAERERQGPIATVGWDRNFMGVVWHGKDMPEKGVETLLYAAPPVTAPVRLTDDQVERALRTNGAYESDAAYAMAKNGLLTDARAIESAALRANGFKVEE